MINHKLEELLIDASKLIFSKKGKGIVYDYLQGRNIKPETIKKFQIGEIIDDSNNIKGYFRNKELFPMYKDTLLLRDDNGTIKSMFSGNVLFPVRISQIK